jgi:hypothetical protein
MSLENHWPAGSLVRVSGAFTDAAAAPIDPTVVRFMFKRPDIAVVTTYVYGVDGALVKDSVGNYHVDVSADVKGEWLYRWESTGTGQAALDSGFFADESRVV